MTATVCTNVPATKRSFSPLAWVAMALETQRERKALSQLESTQLADIGLTVAEASKEVNRPFWDFAAH